MTTPTDLDLEVRARLDETIEHLNGNHADTVLLVARYAAGCTDADQAEVATIDSGGVDFDVVVGDRGPRTIVRWPFPEALTSVDDAYTHLYAAIARARTVAGDRMPITSLEQESADQASIPTFYTSVAAVVPIAEGLLQLELEGGLGEFRTLGGDQFFYLMLPRPGGEPIPDGYTMADYMAQDVEERPIGAYYTVRRWDRERRRMTLWAVIHGHAGGVGGWIERCAVGDRVVIWGPRHSFSPQPGSRSQLLVADETGFGAVAAILDETPAGVRSTVVLETIDERHAIDLGSYPDVTVHWVFRGGDEPGTGDRLLGVVRDLELETEGLVAFGAAESRQITAVRSHLRHHLGLRADRVFMTGYWRRNADR